MMQNDEGSQMFDSPLASLREPVAAPDALAEGPVKYLLVSGGRDNGRWGLVGAFWVSIDGSRGGFLVAPEAIWQGSEMVRSYKSARQRGWSHEEVYHWWQSQVGLVDTIMIDPQEHADTLFQVARWVGCL
jgi:hypothetical protein